MPIEHAQTPIDSRENGLADFIDFAHPDLFYKAQVFARFLQDGRSRGFATYIRRVRNYDRGAAVVDGEVQDCDRHVVMMASADYLGFARHPAITAAAQQAISQFGVSTCSVPIMAGATSLHRELEVALASFVGAEDCVLFPTGLAANVGAIQALCTYRDTVVLDKSVHYSILDGVRLSGARWRSFHHSDPEHLARVLKAVRSENRESGILVVIEGIYGIDGDIAPVPELVDICGRFDARLVVDDAHATGVVGPSGRGSWEFHGISDPPSLIMGSLSKAFGSFGGWLATSQQVADYLRYYARTIAFSVGLPPSCAGAAMTALTFLRDDPQHLSQLRANIAFFRDGLLALGIRSAERSASAMMSVPVGSEGALREIARELFRSGVYAEPLPFPAVPHGQERIRFRVSLTKILCNPWRRSFPKRTAELKPFSDLLESGNRIRRGMRVQ